MWVQYYQVSYEAMCWEWGKFYMVLLEEESDLNFFHEIHFIWPADQVWVKQWSLQQATILAK